MNLVTRANQPNQKLYYNALKQWAELNNVTVFFFEAFDEPWKGNDDVPNAAEKNWGVYYEDRSPKLVLQKRLKSDLYSLAINN